MDCLVDKMDVGQANALNVAAGGTPVLFRSKCGSEEPCCRLPAKFGCANQDAKHDADDRIIHGPPLQTRLSGDPVMLNPLVENVPGKHLWFNIRHAFANQ